MSKLRFIVLTLSLASAISAQGIPVGSHVYLAFPHFADGGPSAGQWQTTFTFVNPNSSTSDVDLFLFGDDGRSLSLDLGLGLGSHIQFSIPAHGSKVLRSKIASAATVTGWAVALASYPLQATVAFRLLERGVPKQEITAQATSLSTGFSSFAVPSLGVAIANPDDTETITVILSLQDNSGLPVGKQTVVLRPLTHTAFNISQQFPGLSPDFSGVVTLQSTPQRFIAWTLNADSSGVLSSLPPGQSSWPLEQKSQIQLVFARLIETSLRLNLLKSAPTLQISDAPTINAYAINGQTIVIYTALAELISDSESELAFAIGHEIGHIAQAQMHDQADDPTNPEFDADLKGMSLALASGFDPYAGAGTLAKLSMATGQAGLASQFESQTASDAHKSFNTRIDNMFGYLVKVCNTNSNMRAICAEYKEIVHPHLPKLSPLSTTQPGRIQ